MEHIHKNKIEQVLKEYHRILKKGGILRISVPDFKTIIKIYETTGKINYILDPLFGSQEYKYNFHYLVFDYQYLESLLKDSSFTSIRKWTFGEDKLKSIPDWSGKKILIDDKKYEISLNVEAIKA